MRCYQYSSRTVQDSHFLEEIVMGVSPVETTWNLRLNLTFVHPVSPEVSSFLIITYELIFLVSERLSCPLFHCVDITLSLKFSFCRTVIKLLPYGKELKSIRISVEECWEVLPTRLKEKEKGKKCIEWKKEKKGGRKEGE